MSNEFHKISLTVFQIPEPDIEYRFHPTRRWRLDYAWPKYKVAVEIEGGVWIKGRHNRASGFLKDIEKYNSLAEMGWILLRYQPRKVDYEQVKRTLETAKSNLT